MKASEVLRKAREVMNNAGEHWTIGRLAEDTIGVQRFCAIGGLNAAADLPQSYAGEMDHLAEEGRYQARVRATFDLAAVIGYDNDNTPQRWTPDGYITVDENNAKIVEAENVVISFNDGMERDLLDFDTREEWRAASFKKLADKLEEAALRAEARGD